MSLIFGVRDVADWEELDGHDTRLIVFEAMAVGMTKITADNVDEFILRSEFWRKLDNMTLIPRELIERYIGLRTNVSTETWAKFAKRYADDYRVSFKRHRDREREKAAKAAAKTS